MTIDYKIRLASSGDAPAVTRLFRQSYPDLLPRDYDAALLRAALPLITTAQPALLTSGTYYVAESDTGEIVGAGGWTDISPSRGVARAGEGHMRHVAVHPGHLRRGIARAILARAETSARGFGLERLKCLSTLTAERFYASVGFQRLGVIDLTLAPGVHFPAVQMERVLA
ncbi:GNAT family N-acetyltransferase [Shimia biformata]|uniref:GNAT family N-acetyltransferase n=1 Tax=Shimia biformata TaxID=1294299 RepID=UPI00194DC244|nr:GNAT family N-acetyltransferase [Shimia biformata]